MIALFYNLSLYIHDFYYNYTLNLDSIYEYYYDMVLTKVLRRMLTQDLSINILFRLLL